ncbi:hypothetical protein AN416_21625 [Paraburkholderia caribensis]|nr:hypothetical protein AN416_21625 [Paraburkholderia caribensis]AUT53648.1 hypothetical protein C2L66_16865 [Paraburkholderia caribensis]
MRELPPTGKAGFEGLVVNLLSRLVGLSFAIAASGRQDGRDALGRTVYGTQVAVECKRYAHTTLNSRELIGELDQASHSLPHLELWILVASRSIPDILQQDLISAGVSKGICVAFLECFDDEVGSFSALCAKYPEEILRFGGREKDASVENALEAIRNDAHFELQLAALAKTFSSPWYGYEQLRASNASVLLSRFADPGESVAAFSQDLAVVPAAIPRERYTRKVSSWYEQSSSAKSDALVVLGDEGDGKSWVAARSVASLLQSDIAPLVLFFPAFSVAQTTPDQLLASALHTQWPVVTIEQWRMRLQRWMSSDGGGFPRILMILDGINEKYPHTHWRRLFSEFDRASWRARVRLLLTCRSSYWKSTFASVFSRNHEVLVVERYDDVELELALHKVGLSRAALPAALFPLVRKPRYFSLAVRHRERLQHTGDLTVARLLYEDWRDRYRRRDGFPIPPDDFNNLLKTLASRSLNSRTDGHSGLTRSTIQDEIDSLRPGNGFELYVELETGGVLEDARQGRIRVVPERLLLGLGLLLADYAMDAYEAGSDIRETILRHLEMTGQIDESSVIVEHAALDALTRDDCHDEVRVALLAVWLDFQNRYDPDGASFIAYLPSRPSTFFALAEVLWSSGIDQTWGQQLIVEAIINWRYNPSVSALAVRYAEKWLGMVASYEDQGTDTVPGTEEAIRRGREGIVAELGQVVDGDTVTIGQSTLRVCRDESLIRLGRMALACISAGPRAQFVDALVVAALAEIVQPQISRMDLVRWVMRTSPDGDDLRQRLFDAVQNLASQSQQPNALFAVHRLLRAEGSETSAEFAKRFPPAVNPRSGASRLYERHREDPCGGLFTWTRADCNVCLTRTDVDADRLLRSAKRFLLEPGFPAAPGLLDRIDLSIFAGEGGLWQHRSRALVESRLDDIAVGFYAWAPERLASMFREIFSGAATRSGDALWALATHVTDYAMILDTECRRVLVEICASLPEHFAGQDLLQTELMLFAALLDGWDAREQLTHLLARSSGSFDALMFEDHFKSVDFEFCNAFPVPEDELSLMRTVWFMSQSDEFVGSRIFECALAHHVSHIRGMALEALHRSGQPERIRTWLQSGWRHGPDHAPKESYWGSRLVLESNELDAVEIIDRIDPTLILSALQTRGEDNGFIDVVQRWLHDWLSTSVARMERGVIPVLPPLRIVVQSSSADSDFDASTIMEIERDTTRRFVSASAIWGGLFATNNDDETATAEETGARWQARARRRTEAVDAVRRTGGYWVDRRESREVINRVFGSNSSLGYRLLEVISEDNPGVDAFILQSYGLLVGLCEYLLAAEPTLGVDLYHRIVSAGGNVRHEMTDAALTWADTALFDAPASDPVVALWEHRLGTANRDADLLELAILARSGDARRWIEQQIALDRAGSIQFYRARAEVLAGFLGLTLPDHPPDTWLGEVSQLASRYATTDRWAKHWLLAFVTETNDDRAFAAFRLFLLCVDRRFWIWGDAAISEAEELSSARKVFLKEAAGTIRSAVSENENRMTESFLGQAVADGQVWPWLHLVTDDLRRGVTLHAGAASGIA